MRAVDFKSIRRFSRAAAAVAICAWPAGALAQNTGASATSPAAPGTPCPGANLRPTHRDLAAIDRATICLIDRVRGAVGLCALHANGSLQRVAARQSREMVLGDYFGDDSRSGETPLQRIVATRYLRNAAQVSTAQNIGWGTNAQATPAAIVAAWMDSPPHREIVLTEEFRDVGVGVRPTAPAALAAGRAGATYTVEFGTRR
ncbi:MAG TPA: CAP domain-containing protein [Solirubrobacteraceae bacterium]|jgi:uncharacterized protein YkwD